MDRSAINRALAKTMAYKQCGKDTKAEAWAVELLRLLDCHEIIDRATFDRYNAVMAGERG